jgi:ProP effector
MTGDEVFDLLVTRYPKCFYRKSYERKPLKIGIRQDLLDAGTGVAEVMICQFLGRYCAGRDYLWACTLVGTPRIDLAGEPCGAIVEADVHNARTQLAARAKKHNNDGGGPTARPVAPRSTVVQMPSSKSPVTPLAPTTADRAGRLTLAGLRAAAAARKMRA